MSLCFFAIPFSTPFPLPHIYFLPINTCNFSIQKILGVPLSLSVLVFLLFVTLFRLSHQQQQNPDGDLALVFIYLFEDCEAQRRTIIFAVWLNCFLRFSQVIFTISPVFYNILLCFYPLEGKSTFPCPPDPYLFTPCFSSVDVDFLVFGISVLSLSSFFLFGSFANLEGSRSWLLEFGPFPYEFQSRTRCGLWVILGAKEAREWMEEVVHAMKQNN